MTDETRLDDEAPERADPTMHSTEDVIRLLTGALRTVASPITGGAKTAGARFAIFQALLDLSARDPGTMKIVRRLAIARLRDAARGDLAAAKLSEDPRDPFHHAFLLGLSDQALLVFIARGIAEEPDGELPSVLAGMMRMGR